MKVIIWDFLRLNRWKLSPFHTIWLFHHIIWW